ncbi:hypothetical protein DEI81_10380 [Curtobacterium sp. MCBD17_013]|uniref:hypothetical protein n=1 Tax=unclassified Curtobacterium TaxID=257496 RepID=UPI000DA71EC0|nr:MULTISPECIES: hypothetical protein [unclassified Curtobacterium]PZF61797.1 hypothetical protein DEI81_10380 [Curtobacterium sp. MCBD17_013]WIB63364.1 hypothetical protein DEI94_14635 [Curtobacterium sp. MCBD17_040]
MPDLADALALLGEMGLVARLVGPRTVAWNGPSLRVARAIVLDSPPAPSRVEAALGALDPADRTARLLYVLRRASPSLVRRAVEDHRVAVVSVDEGHLVVDGDHWRRDRAAPPERARPRGRTPWGRFALGRVLLRTVHPRTQAALAAEAGITQQAVAKALPALEEFGVSRSLGGWMCADPPALWDHCVDDYPGPGGLRQGWMSAAALDEQVARARAVAGRDVLVSGDLAADALVPWRRPVRAAVWSPVGIDLSARSVVANRLEATLLLTVPEDPTVVATARSWAEASPSTTDPVITAWEIMQTPGPDAHEAAQVLRDAVLSGRDRNAVLSGRDRDA